MAAVEVFLFHVSLQLGSITINTHFTRKRHCMYNMRSTLEIVLSTPFINGHFVLAHTPTTWESLNVRNITDIFTNQANIDECNTGRKSTVINIVLSLSSLLYLWEMRHRRRINYYEN